MPPIYRHVVPIVPETAGNGKPCYRGNAPSCQAKMMIAGLTWTGDVDISSLGGSRQTITQAEMQTAMTAFLDYAYIHNLYNTEFYYGVAKYSKADNFEVWTELTSGTWVVIDTGLRIGYFGLDIGLYWNQAETFWKWRAEMTGLQIRLSDVGTVLPLRGNPARFDSSAQTQNIRLGTGQTLYYVGQFAPNFFANAFTGCSLTVSAQYV